MRREDRVSVQGPVKEQQPDGMSHRGLGGQGGTTMPVTGGGTLVQPTLPAPDLQFLDPCFGRGLIFFSPDGCVLKMRSVLWRISNVQEKAWKGFRPHPNLILLLGNPPPQILQR